LFSRFSVVRIVTKETAMTWFNPKNWRPFRFLQKPKTPAHARKHKRRWNSLITWKKEKRARWRRLKG
jgi:hypothetical protein